MTLPGAAPIYTRRRSAALIETPAGILLVEERTGVCSLPGGGVEANESVQAAAIRELQEETTLQAVATRFLFEHLGKIYVRKGRSIQNHHFIFLVEAIGTPQPNDDGIRQICFYRPGDRFKITDSTERILAMYFTWKQTQG